MKCPECGGADLRHVGGIKPAELRHWCRFCGSLVRTKDSQPKRHEPPAQAKSHAATRVALGIVTDPLFRDKSWAEAQAALHMDPNEEVEFQCYASAQHSCWLFTRLADLALAGNADGLLEFIRVNVPTRYDAARASLTLDSPEKGTAK